MIHDIETAYRSGDWVTVKTLTHNLKGTGGGMGYPDVTHMVAKLEFEAANRNDAMIATSARGTSHPQRENPT